MSRPRSDSTDSIDNKSPEELREIVRQSRRDKKQPKEQFLSQKIQTINEELKKAADQVSYAIMKIRQESVGFFQWLKGCSKLKDELKELLGQLKVTLQCYKKLTKIALKNLCNSIKKNFFKKWFSDFSTRVQIAIGTIVAFSIAVLAYFGHTIVAVVAQWGIYQVGQRCILTILPGMGIIAAGSLACVTIKQIVKGWNLAQQSKQELIKSINSAKEMKNQLNSQVDELASNCE